MVRQNILNDILTNHMILTHKLQFCYGVTLMTSSVLVLFDGQKFHAHISKRQIH